MFDLDTALLIAALAAGWFWLDNIGARDAAVAAGRQAAEKYGLQLLDETVALHRLRLARDEHGRLRLQRTYRFEVSQTGADRLPCSLTLLGRQLASLDIPPLYDNVVRLY